MILRINGSKWEETVKAVSFYCIDGRRKEEHEEIEDS